MPKLTKGKPATFIVRGNLFWHESPCNLSLRTGSYLAVPTLRRNGSDDFGEPVRWEITKETGLLTMSAMQAECFQRDGKLEIEQ